MKKNNIFIIAEAGVNHNGSLDLAYKLIDEAKNIGADAIKFQSFKTDDIVTQKASMANYQIKNSSFEQNQFTMLKKLELTFEEFHKLKKKCDENDIIFLSTPFDLTSLDFLVKELNVKMIKISSGDLTNSPLLFRTGSHMIDIIISTGMSNLDEINKAILSYSFGFERKNINFKNSLTHLNKVFETQIWKETISNKINLLHCTTQYPAPYKDINLLNLETMKKSFNIQIGYSDHSIGKSH